MKNSYWSFSGWIVGGIILLSLLFLADDPLKLRVKGNASVQITDNPVQAQIVEIPDNSKYVQAQIVEIPDNSKYVQDILRLKPTLDPWVADAIASSVMDASEKYNIPEELIIAIMKTESSFDVTAISNKKCIGLMQVNPAVWNDEIRKRGLEITEVFHIGNNIDLGTWIFQQYYYETGSVQKALVKYLGALNTKYILGILDTYTSLTVPLVITPEEEKVEK